MASKWRVKLAAKLLEKDAFVLFGGNEEGGYCIWRYTPELCGVVKDSMENNEQVKDFILGSAREYLKRYIIDRNNFAKEIYED